MKKNYRMRKILFILGLLLLPSGCLEYNREWDNFKRIELTIAQIYTLSHTPGFLVFSQMKLPERVNKSVKVRRIFFPNGQQIIEAVMNNEVDIAYLGVSSPLSGWKKNPNYKIIAGTNIGGNAILASKNSGIQSISDLKGKRVGVHAFASPFDILLGAVILPKNNLSIKDIKLRQAKAPELGTRLKEGTLDVVYTFEPWVSRILQDNELNATILLDYNEIWRNGSYPTSVVVARTEFIKKHPELVKEFLRAHVDAVLFANSHPEETKKIVHDEILRLSGKELPMKVIESAFTRVKLTYDPQVDAVMELANFTHQAYPDMLPRIPTKKELFDLSLLNEVLAEKGLPPVKT